MKFYGHISKDGSKKQFLEVHLRETADLAAKFAAKFGAKALGYLIAYCHDLGKYSAEGQARVAGIGPKVDHSTAGGQVINKLAGVPWAYPVLGHHVGLPDGGNFLDTEEMPTLYARLKRKSIPNFLAYKQELRFEAITEPPQIKLLDKGGFSLSFLIRMLFSCLVDADYLNTEPILSEVEKDRSEYPTVLELHEKLEHYRNGCVYSESELNRRRDEIQQWCLNAAEDTKGYFSLTAPTGSGKTIASLVFALNHMKKWHMDRLIYVLPQVTIMEQIAEVFKGVLGANNVLEHHHCVSYDDENIEDINRKKLSTENWDAPVIVTSNVQFFESLYSSRPSKCRKLHNIANSVIVLDEAQQIPAGNLEPCVRALTELVQNYGCTVVFCTATQPALDYLLPESILRREICTNLDDLFGAFRRANLKYVGRIRDPELAAKMNGMQQVLTIVNTKKQAKQLYTLLDQEGSYHLSALMKPKHRNRILKKIRKRLKDNLPCRVVATSLVEAGVNLDFPIVYRERAGLDSIIQTMGRCNREWENPTENSFVYVFDADETYEKNLPRNLRLPIAAFEITARRFEDLQSLEAIKFYFQKLYQLKGEFLDEKKVVERLEAGAKDFNFPFRQIDRDFYLIPDHMHSILIPADEVAQRLAEQLREGKLNKKLLRSMGPYVVNVYTKHYKNLISNNVLEIIDSEIAILKDMKYYSDNTGLWIPDEVDIE